MDDVLHFDKAAAVAAWAARVRANREQAERLREAPERPDFYAPVASAFRADPRRTGEAALDALRALVVPGETWLDIGAGGGRYALPIALLAGEVLAVDPSDAMLGILREGMAEHGISNVTALPGRWPMEAPPEADVSLIAHVAYDIEAFGTFLDAMEAATRRLCVAVLQAQSPAAVAARFWPVVHGEPRSTLPALPEFLALQLARGRLCEVRLSSRPPMVYPSRDVSLGFVRQQLFIEPGGPKDQILESSAPGMFFEVEGGFALTTEPVTVGVVSWAPR